MDGAFETAAAVVQGLSKLQQHWSRAAAFGPDLRRAPRVVKSSLTSVFVSSIMAANWYMACAMLPRAIWLGSRRPFAGAAASIAINSAYFLSQKNGIFREHPPFWSVPGRRTRCRALSTRYGSPTYRPRVVDAATPAPSEPEDGREAAHSRDAASRRRRGPRTNQRRTATHVYKSLTPRAATTIAGARID